MYLPIYFPNRRKSFIFSSQKFYFFYFVSALKWENQFSQGSFNDLFSFKAQKRSNCRHHFMPRTTQSMKRKKGGPQQTKVWLSIPLLNRTVWWIFHELLSIGLRFEKKAEIYISCVSQLTRWCEWKRRSVILGSSFCLVNYLCRCWSYYLVSVFARHDAEWYGVFFLLSTW